MRRLRTIGLFWVCAALSLCAVSIARGTESPTIVLVADHADASIIATLRAELSALGLETLVVPRGNHAMSPGELTEAARQNHAIAAFHVSVEEHRVEVWLADRLTGKVLLREVLMSKDLGTSQTDESTVVARAVELLRASLLELDIDDRPRGDVHAPANLPVQIHPTRAVATVQNPERAARYGISAGAELLAASSHAAISSGLGVSLQWYATQRWSLQASTTVPFSGSRYTASQGRAEVSPRWVSLGVSYRAAKWSDWQVWLDSGVGLLLTDSVGIAGPGYLARASFGVDPVAYLGAEVSYSLSQPLALALGTLGGPGLRPTKIMFADQVVDRYGQWLIMSQVGLKLTWD
jgi:hypothetical protein